MLFQPVVLWDIWKWFWFCHLGTLKFTLNCSRPEDDWRTWCMNGFFFFKREGFFPKRSSHVWSSIIWSFLEACHDRIPWESSYITAHMQAIRTQPCFKGAASPQYLSLRSPIFDLNRSLLLSPLSEPPIVLLLHTLGSPKSFIFITQSILTSLKDVTKGRNVFSWQHPVKQNENVEPEVELSSFSLPGFSHASVFSLCC